MVSAVEYEVISLEELYRFLRREVKLIGVIQDIWVETGG